MERRRDGIGRPAPRLLRDYPSFSSTLLDAIYRSIDETDDRGATHEHRTGGAPDSHSGKKQSNSFVSESRRPPAVTAPPMTRTRRDLLCRGFADSSSSSDGSSYGGFSSSEAESISVPHITRLRPIRTIASAVPLSPAISGGDVNKKAKNDRQGSFTVRIRDLRKGRAPASPGARLANFLSSLFAAKSKVSSTGGCGGAGNQSGSSTASSWSRSCMRKTPSSKEQPSVGKRTVRFCPVSVIVGEDCRPCGEKLIYGGVPPTGATTAPVRRSVVEEEREDGGSDSSSDLFELENLAVTFRDELPVYETTRLRSYAAMPNRASLL